MKKVISFFLVMFIMLSGAPVALAKTPQCEINNEHLYTNYVYNKDATEYLDGTKTAICDYGCGEKNTVTAIGTAVNPTIIDLKLNKRIKVNLKPQTGVIFKITSEHNWYDGDEYWIEEVFDSSLVKYIITNFYYDERYGGLDGGIGDIASWGCYSAQVANEIGHIYYLSVFNSYDKEITYSSKLLLETACEHNYEFKETIAPSCINKGYDIYVCTECGDNEHLNSVPATGICNFKEKYVIEPTCYQGYTYYMCECGNGYNGSYVPATGHVLNEWYNDDETCYSDGTKRVSCMSCEDVYYTEVVQGTMTSHRFSNYKSDKDGTKTGYCIFGCGATDTVINNENYDDFQYYVSDSEVTITKYVGSETDIIIPAFIEGYPVVNLKGAIFSEAWYDRDLKISSLFIPASVEFIDDIAFDGCYYIKSIKVDKDNNNFSSDKYNVLFNKDKTVLIKYTIGHSRKSYKIPSSVVTIAEEAFRSCNGIENIIIPDSVKTISDYAFSSCSNLVNVSMGKNVEYIGFRGFEWCEKLGDVTFPETLKEIGVDAFQFCNSLKNVVLPDSLVTLGMYAFEGWADFDKIVIGRGLKDIPRLAFGGDIGEIIIPDTVEKIEDDALGYNVRHLCYEGTKEQWNNIYKFSTSTFEYIHFNYNPDSAIIEKYKQPTCTSIGEKRTECACGMIIDRELLMSENHVFGNYYSDNNATCTEQGTKTAVCIYGCGEKETVADENSVPSHSFVGSVCKECGYDKAEACTCNCHKSGLVGIIWKIINIFNRLFKINRDCACGATHY